MSIASNIIKLASAAAFAFQVGAGFSSESQSAETTQKSVNAGLPGSRGHSLSQKVDACVVDLWDTSISVTDERFRMEQIAFAKALESQELSQALKKLPNQRIAMNVAFFDYSAKPVTNGWVMVDEKTRFDLAETIRTTGRMGNGYTQTDRAIDFALTELQKCDSERPVIDLVTDGKLNFPGCQPMPYNCVQGLPIAMRSRDEATSKGVTINVLAIQIDKDPGLAQWARDYMATPSYADQEKRGLGLVFGREASPGKVFEIDGNVKMQRDEWIQTFSTMRARKLIEEIAHAPRVGGPG